MRSRLSLFVRVAILLSLALIPVSGWAAVYVDGDNIKGPWNGDSWATAYKTVQEGMDDAQKAGEEVWVAEGTYYPTSTNDKSAAIMLRSGVALYGGFKGTERGLDQRNWERNVTILSGDIGKKGDDSDNSTHVVIGADDAVIDGFTVTGGRGPRRGPGGSKGPPGMGPPGGKGFQPGMRPPGMNQGSAKGPPGMGAKGGKGFQPGMSPPGMGKGPQSSIHISPDQILQGIGPHGAGMINYQCAPTIRNCIFKDNRAGKGGAMYNMMSRRPGPGSSEAAPVLINVTFEDNYAIGRGGAVSNDLGTSPTFINCSFINNKTDGKGGGVYNDFHCSPTFISCLFVGNSAEGGGAMGNDGGSSPIITNCTFTGNYASSQGAALYQGSGSANNPVVTSCILWGNTVPVGASEIYVWHESDPTITYSCIEGGYPGKGNIDMDPMFVDPKNRDYRLAPGSPCIDSGNGGVAPEKDMAGKARYDDKGVPDGHEAAPKPRRGPPASKGGGPGFGPPGASPPPASPVDMGAYERLADTKVPSQAVVYVDADNANGPWDGRTWKSAFNDLQKALDHAYSAGSEVWVAEGTYKPTTGNNRGASIRLRKGVALYGGFQGTEKKRDLRNWEKNATILSGDIGMQGDIHDNSYHVLVGEDDAVVDGFMITSGNANATIFDSKGGGLVNYRTSPGQGQGGPSRMVLGFSLMLSNCTFYNNHAIEGGAIYNFDKSASNINNCVFKENRAYNGGAIVERVGTKTVMTDCSFIRNHSVWRGGAVYCDYGARPEIVDCDFSENTTDGHGGGIYGISRASQVEHTIITVRKSRFNNNYAKWRGGGFANYDNVVLEVIDSLFTGNRAGKGGGVLANDYRSGATFTGCTFKGNRADEGKADIDSDASSSLTVNK
ncbi:MAG: hypothetical protein JRI43_02120 [Deltaproteobacteria bacterium]|nr:hypothetical protein [Deltaproteobacteria bacterium]